MLTQDEIQKERIALLKLELTNLTTKINNSVDNLWKVRTVAIAIWVAAMGYGLDPIRSGKTPHIPIILITLLIPLWFYWIDAKYNRWYRHITFREWQIQQFINVKGYVLPSTNERMSFNQLTELKEFPFPVYDIAGKETFGGDPDFKWQVSLLRNWIDSIPAFIYGSQLLVSAIVLTLYTSDKWKYVFIPSVLMFFLVLGISAQLKRRSIFNVAINS